ncbi:MAG: hypothetical protein H7306_23885 [Bacteriovorax sp.]|nr:hypothetical protein [Rhizobacter sp.]
MNLTHTRCTSHYLTAAALGALLLIAAPFALAGPGAHGPNGEHLDGPTTVRAASALPRVEAQTDTFELVAELRPSELVIVIDRFESNEPVLGAKLEVESGTLKAVAAFRAEQGDYAVTDAALLKALAAPGEHGLVFTLVAGKESDLLDATLVTAGGGVAATASKNDHGQAHGSGDHDHSLGHDHELERAAWIGAGVAVLGLIGGVGWWRQRRRDTGKLQGGL